MRYVNRTKVTPPISLIEKNSIGKVEHEAAKLHYEEPRSSDKSFKFSAYKGDDVKKALEDLFDGKCAYCEISYIGSQPMDVEHYRPKAGIQENPMHTGYWWLAATWENLLPSCIDCNRRRRQLSADRSTTLEELSDTIANTIDKVPQGKQNSFPTENHVWANFSDDYKSIERPLLINPTEINPEDHLHWPLSEISIIIPKENAHGVICARGKTSIETYALNRVGLVKCRLEVRQTMDFHIETIKTMAITAMTLPGDAKNEILKKLSQEIVKFREYHEDAKRSFLSMRKSRIQNFVTELNDMLGNITDNSDTL